VEHFWNKCVLPLFDECCAEYYKSIVKKLPDNSKLVEIGVFTGASLSVLVVENVNLDKKHDILAIDPWSNDWYNGPTSLGNHDGDSVLALMVHVFQQNRVPDKAFRFVRDYSFNVAKTIPDETLDFVFIDGGHEFHEVSRDIVDWLPKVKPGGILAGHDLQYKPVKDAVEVLLPHYTTKCEHIWEITK
jgi:hypothetical protein